MSSDTRDDLSGIPEPSDTGDQTLHALLGIQEPTPTEAYPAGWVRVVLRVSPTGEMHAVGGDRDGGEGDCPYPGLDRIKATIAAAVQRAEEAEAERDVWIAEATKQLQLHAETDTKYQETLCEWTQARDRNDAALAASQQQVKELTAAVMAVLETIWLTPNKMNYVKDRSGPAFTQAINQLRSALSEEQSHDT